MYRENVLGRFEISERLGSGGFGTVYRAWDSRLERDVAVKVIEIGADPGVRVTREAQAAARLNHAGIVTLYEYDFRAGCAYLVSELVEGDTLQVLIDRDRLSDRDVAEVGADVCEALDHAHSRGVVHRDLKPANLILDRGTGAAKLMDFGIARLTDGDDLTTPGDVLGTLAYMPPEQAEGDPVGPGGDVYSLCLTLFEAWSGENPRRRSTPTATARAVDEAMPSLAEFRGDLPRRLTDVVDAGLSHDPARRPSVEVLGTVLEDSLSFLDDYSPEPIPSKLASDSTFSDFSRIIPAVGVGSMTAGVLLVSGQADFISVAVLALITSLVTLLQARLGFLSAGAATAAWLILAADLPGAAIVVGLLVLVPAVFCRGSGRALAISPLGPLLGLAGLAPFLPFIAGLAEQWKDRAAVAATGLAWTALAASASGRNLLFAKVPEASPGWADSVSSAFTGLLIPTLTTGTFLLSLIVWATVAVCAGSVLARVRRRRPRGHGLSRDDEGAVSMTSQVAERFPSLP